MAGTAVAEVLLRTVRPCSSALVDVLREAARLTDSYGCILWRSVPSSDSGALFILADSFHEEIANHDLLGARSVTGLAIRAQKQQTVVIDDDGFVIESIRAMSTTPVQFHDGEVGSLNFYRTAVRTFKEGDLATAREIAGLLPFLYDIIHKQISFELMKRVDEAAHQLETSTSATATICTGIRDAFDCIETSIYLEDRLESPGDYRLAATTASAGSVRDVYRADPSDGITGWSLAHPEMPVRIFDVASADPDELKCMYAGLHWTNSSAVAKMRSPVSVMTAPIVRSGKAMGLIRCFGRKSPAYFSDSEHKILQMIASRLAAVWGGLLDRRELDEQSRSLETLVVKIDELNARAYGEMTKSHPQENEILQDVLRIARSVIPGATIDDVRLLSDDSRMLRFAAVHGEAWDQGSSEEAQSRKMRVYPVSDPPTSIGSHVVQTGKVYITRDLEHHPYHSKTFPGVKKLIVAPVCLRNETFGVLDIRGTSERDFPPYAASVAGLLGTQLALYLKLSSTVRHLRRLHETQEHMNQDMAHQFKSPILAAHARVQDALRHVHKKVDDPELLAILLAARGACARAMHVSQNSYLFARLARGSMLEIHKTFMTGDELASLLVNTATDVSQLYLESRQTGALWSRRDQRRPHFHVNVASFDNIGRFEVDRDLLEQAVTQILDNAFKYSFQGTTVAVTGGHTHRGQRRDRIRISVINEGVELTEKDVTHCRERGWQSETTIAIREGGVGIGLWIVDQIMKALGGELQIHPTDQHSRTEVSLILPAH